MQAAYNAYNEKPSYAVYEESPSAYDSRGYMAPPHATAVVATAPAAANPAAYPASDAEYGPPRYYSVEGGGGGGRVAAAAAYPVADNCPDQQYATDKGRYSTGYGYEQRCYYDQAADGRYAAAPPAECRYAMEVRYADARHPDGRHPVDPGREADCRYMADGREMDSRRCYVVDGREHVVDGRYAMQDNREIDGRYAVVAPDGRDAAVDGRYADPTRYPAKENYYDRYYKHRPSRDHHHHHGVADTRY